MKKPSLISQKHENKNTYFCFQNANYPIDLIKQRIFRIQIQQKTRHIVQCKSKTGSQPQGCGCEAPMDGFTAPQFWNCIALSVGPNDDAGCEAPMDGFTAPQSWNCIALSVGPNDDAAAKPPWKGSRRPSFGFALH